MGDGTVDWDRLTRHVGADPGFLRELLSLYLAQRDKHAASIRKALSEGDAALLASAAHALKGVVGNLCAPQVWEKASRFEECARKGGGPEAAGLWSDLEAGLEDLARDLREKTS